MTSLKNACSSVPNKYKKLKLGTDAKIVDCFPENYMLVNKLRGSDKVNKVSNVSES
jgi:hypothetical protein